MIKQDVFIRILLALVFVAILGGVFFLYRHEKSISNLQYKDSIFTENLNKKIFSIDSVNIILKEKDSIQSLNHIKLKNSIAKTKKDFIITADSIGFLPDL